MQKSKTIFNPLTILFVSMASIASLWLVSCGVSPITIPRLGTDTYSIGGSVSGLTGTLALQNNAADDLTITADGTFTFVTELTAGSAYEVTVLTQPTNQTCSIASGSGTASDGDVSSISVTCNTTSFSVGGTVSGLTGTLVLQNNSGDNLSLTANGSFTFATAVANSATYSVTVLTQPSGRYCSISNASGTISGTAVTNVSVTCIAQKILFITAAATNGNLGGIAGADAFCNADANKPNASTYKAMISDGATRIACTTASCSGGPGEHTDWPLAANTRYVRADGTTEIATTNANALFPIPLTNTYLVALGTNQAARIWVGLYSDWTSHADRCTGWTVADATQGAHARQDTVSSQAVNYSFQDCSDTNSLACAEQ